MPFYLEKPGDEYGNIGYWHREGDVPCSWGPDEEKPAMIPVLECVVEDTSCGEDLRVVAPSTFAQHWETLSTSRFIEVDGPQRFLSDEEAHALWAAHGLWPVKDFTEHELMGLSLAAMFAERGLPLSREMQAHVDHILESHMQRTREES